MCSNSNQGRPQRAKALWSFIPIKVKAIVNSHPLTTDLLSNVNSMIPLNPINLLTLKSGVVMPPPEVFTTRDIYCSKIGEEYNTSLMSFGVDGEKKFL